MCQKFKNDLDFYNLTYTEHLIDEDVTRERLLEMFPWATTLPVVVINGEGITVHEATIKLNEYKEHFGKTLLNETGD
jgi:hypothetical protein